MRSLERIWIIRNPAAGKDSQKYTEELLNELAAREVRYTLYDTKCEGHAKDIAFNACQRNVGLLIVCGGDGTLNEVINGVMSFYGEYKQNLPRIAVYPAGTANLVAQELNMPRNAVRFVDILFAQNFQLVYPGKVNDKFFIATVGIGFDAYIVSGVSKKLKRTFSKLAYVFRTLLMLTHSWKREYTVIADGKYYKAAALIIVKSRYYAGKYIVTSEASLSKANIYVCIMERQDRWNVFTYILSLLWNRLYRHKYAKVICANSIRIEGPVDDIIQVDGDASEGFPVTISRGETAIQLIRS